MDKDKNLIQRQITAAIATANSFEESIALYEKFLPYIEDYQFALSTPSGAKVPTVVANKTFTSGARIQSLFDATEIFWLDSDSLQQHKISNRIWFLMDYTLSLDTQAVSYLQGFVEKGRKPTPDFIEVIEYIVKNKINIDASPFMMENIPNLSTMENGDKIFKKLVAFDTIGTIDFEQLKKYGNILSIYSSSEIQKQAQERLGSMYRIFSDNKSLEQHMFNYNYMYCHLLKMAEIRLEKIKLSNKDKLYEFIAFLHSRFGALGFREIALAKKYFALGPSAFPFFGKIQKKYANIFEALRNMAWDILHIRNLEAAATYPSDKARYFFPAFLTFDKDLSEVISTYPLRAYAFSKVEKKMIPFSAIPEEDIVADNESEKAGFAAAYYTYEAIQERESIRKRIDLDSLIRELESSLRKIVQI